MSSPFFGENSSGLKIWLPLGPTKFDVVGNTTLFGLDSDAVRIINNRPQALGGSRIL